VTFGPVVSADWLADHIDDPDLVVADVRWYLDGRSARDVYETGHLPGAVFVDLDVDLSAPPSAVGGRHPLPEPAAFAAAMGALGIGDTTRVVAYDDTGGITAGRLWWMLDVLGREVAVLDGGIAAWTDELSTATAAPVGATFTASAWPADRLMSADELEASLGGDLVVLDARSPERYSSGGAVDPRPGHVPGARNAPSADNLSDGVLRPAPELAARYSALGAHERPVVAYCGSGVSACIDLLALRRAGLPDGRLFVGSWSAWGADENRPAEEGPDPG